jgi:hypothetical protein
MNGKAAGSPLYGTAASSFSHASQVAVGQVQLQQQAVPRSRILHAEAAAHADEQHMWLHNSFCTPGSAYLGSQHR